MGVPVHQEAENVRGLSATLKRIRTRSLSRPSRTSGRILTIYTSYDVFPHNEVPFWGPVDTVPHIGVKIQKKTILGA